MAMQARYKRMLEGMKKNAKKKRRNSKRAQKWFVYMLNCADQTLYTGITNDMERRFKTHSAGKGARYTRARLPLEVVYRETCATRTDAMVRECAVKALPRKSKLKLAGKFQKKAARSKYPKSKVVYG